MTRLLMAPGLHAVLASAVGVITLCSTTYVPTWVLLVVVVMGGLVWFSGLRHGTAELLHPGPIDMSDRAVLERYRRRIPGGSHVVAD